MSITILETYFKNLAKENRLSHAYLFFGEPQEEKFIFAQKLAHFLEKNSFQIGKETLSELLIINDKSSQNEKIEGAFGIDSINRIKKFLWQKPVFSRYRTVIINQAENLTTEAQSAILKILEEPPESALIILIAKSEEGIFPTLLSRMHRIYFPNFSRPSALISDEEKKDFKRRLLKPELIEDIVQNEKIDQFFSFLISDLAQEPVKNFRQLKEVLSRLTLIKRYNTNKRLQLKALVRSLNL